MQGKCICLCSERKEALPLPLYVVTQWEAYICSGECNDAFCILLGGFLLAVHASLRALGLVTSNALGGIVSHLVGQASVARAGPQKPRRWASRLQCCKRHFFLASAASAVSKGPVPHLGNHVCTHGRRGARLHAAMHSSIGV